MSMHSKPIEAVFRDTAPFKGGEMIWVDGAPTRAVKAGGICYLDEIVEARKDITVDKAEHSYLAHMYGHVLIDDLAKLPLKVPEIYRKLTT